MEQSSTTTLEPVDEVRSRSVSPRFVPCMAQIRALGAHLAGAERRSADWILAHPDETLVASINEVARQSQVGVGTVARLCARLGYAGFPELRIALAVEMLNPDLSSLEQVQRGDGPDDVIRKVTQLGRQVLAETAALLDPQELARAAIAVVAARRVIFYAQGGYTAPIAFLAQSRFLILEVLAVAYTGELDQAASARLAGVEDVVVGLSYTGDARPVVEALDVASAQGATTVCITNTPGSPITASAGIRLIASSQEGSSWGHPASSRMGMLAVIDALYAYALLLRYGDEAPEVTGEPPGS